MSSTALCWGTPTLRVEMASLQKNHTHHLGYIQIKSYHEGILLTPHLKGLPTGMHGFHVHQNPSCASYHANQRFQPGYGAGNHFDPQNTALHHGPYRSGHLGDLPNLYVNTQHQAQLPIFAPNINIKALIGRSLIIHENEDNYENEPKLGGSGTRIACGIIEGRTG